MAPAPRRERPMNPDGTPRRRPRRPMMNPDGTPRRRPVRRPEPVSDERRDGALTDTAKRPESGTESTPAGEENPSEKQIIAVPNPDAPMIDLVTMEQEEKKADNHADDEIPAENKAEQI